MARGIRQEMMDKMVATLKDEQHSMICVYMYNHSIVALIAQWLERELRWRRPWVQVLPCASE